MNETSFEIKKIAQIHNDFPSKFGIPRQSGIADALKATIIFEPEYRDANAVRGLEGFSHIWLIWQFSKAVGKIWSPTVKPPRLGGNTRMGVFATRSPFRPNRLGLSVVKLIKVINQNNKITLQIEGADLVDGTPIIDIKPYIKFVDSIENAQSGFAKEAPQKLVVNFTDIALEKINNTKIPQFKELIIDVLSQDPRPSYKKNETSDRVYGVLLYNINVLWKVKNNEIIVIDLEV